MCDLVADTIKHPEYNYDGEVGGFTISRTESQHSTIPILSALYLTLINYIRPMMRDSGLCSAVKGVLMRECSMSSKRDTGLLQLLQP